MPNPKVVFNVLSSPIHPNSASTSSLLLNLAHIVTPNILLDLRSSPNVFPTMFSSHSTPLSVAAPSSMTSSTQNNPFPPRPLNERTKKRKFIGDSNIQTSSPIEEDNGESPPVDEQMLSLPSPCFIKAFLLIL